MSKMTVLCQFLPIYDGFFVRNATKLIILRFLTMFSYDDGLDNRLTLGGVMFINRI